VGVTHNVLRTGRVVALAVAQRTFCPATTCDDSVTSAFANSRPNAASVRAGLSTVPGGNDASSAIRRHVHVPDPFEQLVNTPCRSNTSVSVRPASSLTLTLLPSWTTATVRGLLDPDNSAYVAT